MAKRYKRKSSKCPEPFNILIDIAGGIAMAAVASHMEKKYHYRKRGVPNPYHATAIEMAAGRINSTEDIIALGGIMGAMGSFDDEEFRGPRKRYLSSEGYSINHSDGEQNKYAWRLNCEDGEPYGLNPNDFETREAYHAAILAIKGDANTNRCEPRNSATEVPCQKNAMETICLCKISRLDNGDNLFFRTAENSVFVGEQIKCCCDGKWVQAIVLSAQTVTTDNSPIPLETVDFLVRERPLK